MTTWTQEHAAKLQAYLSRDGYIIPTGLGTKEAACSVAAIRLAWDGVLSDDPPPCMSPVLARWIIAVQDAMPADVRNGAKWRSLLPLAAGTGREREAERLAIIMGWMWATVLPTVQPAADARSFGAEWRTMCEQRTVAAARAAARAAASEADSAADSATRAANWAASAVAREAAREAASEAAREAAREAASEAAREAASAAWAAARAAAREAASEAAAREAWAAARAAASAAWAANRAAEVARVETKAAWVALEPAKTLRVIIEAGAP